MPSGISLWVRQCGLKLHVSTPWYCVPPVNGFWQWPCLLQQILRCLWQVSFSFTSLLYSKAFAVQVDFWINGTFIAPATSMAANFRKVEMPCVCRFGVSLLAIAYVCDIPPLSWFITMSKRLEAELDFLPLRNKAKESQFSVETCYLLSHFDQYCPWICCCSLCFPLLAQALVFSLCLQGFPSRSPHILSLVSLWCTYKLFFPYDSLNVFVTVQLSFLKPVFLLCSLGGSIGCGELWEKL